MATAYLDVTNIFFLLLADKCMEKEAPLQLAGSVSRSLLAQLQEKNNSVPLKLRWFSELFFVSFEIEASYFVDLTDSVNIFYFSRRGV